MEDRQRNYDIPIYQRARDAYREARENGMNVFEAHNVYTFVYHKCRKEYGICAKCGGKAEQGKSMCAKCLSITNQRAKRLNDKGLCVCGSPVRPGKKSCEMCAKVAHIRYLQRKAAKQNDGKGED